MTSFTFKIYQKYSIYDKNIHSLIGSSKKYDFLPIKLNPKFVVYLPLSYFYATMKHAYFDVTT